jgi:hypothetical protein
MEILAEVYPKRKRLDRQRGDLNALCWLRKRNRTGGEFLQELWCAGPFAGHDRSICERRRERMAG